MLRREESLGVSRRSDALKHEALIRRFKFFVLARVASGWSLDLEVGQRHEGLVNVVLLLLALSGLLRALSVF